MCWVWGNQDRLKGVGQGSNSRAEQEGLACTSQKWVQYGFILKTDSNQRQAPQLEDQ